MRRMEKNKLAHLVAEEWPAEPPTNPLRIR